MYKALLTLFLFICSYTGVAQHVQLRYAGTNQKIIEAVAEANRILNNAEFYQQVEAILQFDNTVYTGKMIVEEMNKINTIEVTEYYKLHTKTTAKTQTRIRMNTAKLNRSLASITNTLIHETIHAVDWLTNQYWNYTHKTQYVENPAISAPYVIGSIAQKMVQ